MLAAAQAGAAVSAVDADVGEVQCSLGRAIEPRAGGVHQADILHLVTVVQLKYPMT